MTLDPRLTKRQREVLAFMCEFFADNDQLPTCQCIADHFGWRSQNSASTFTAILEAKGYIERNALNKYRFARPSAVVPTQMTRPIFLQLPVRSTGYQPKGAAE